VNAISSGYRPKPPPCVECAHHRAAQKRNLLFRLRTVHRCYVKFDKRSDITGEPLREVFLCEDARGWLTCNFEEIKTNGNDAA
jgi:hypothetical protein